MSLFNMQCKPVARLVIEKLPFMILLINSETISLKMEFLISQQGRNSFLPTFSTLLPLKLENLQIVIHNKISQFSVEVFT